MNNRERFKAIARFEKPDYTPIIAFPWTGGVCWGVVEADRLRLVSEGMPDWVGNSDYDHKMEENSPQYKKAGSVSWMKYWGVTMSINLDFFPAEPEKGIKTVKRIEGEWEIIESETGAITRQVLNNDVTYSMPQFIQFDVRDRQSWYYYRDRMTPGKRWDDLKINEASKRYDHRDQPLEITIGGWGGFLRGLMGPELAMTILYDDPALAHEMMEWNNWNIREYVYPLIKRLKPEIVNFAEDICYNHGMLISPKLFNEFCASFYMEACQFSKDCGVDFVGVDTDGNAMEFADVVIPCGVNALFPFEVKAGNDIIKLREKHKQLIMLGGLEKEILNKGNTHLIKEEIMSKVPKLVDKGGFFPNIDHCMQPYVTFENLCIFNTILHDVLNNPEGEFPRIR